MELPANFNKFNYIIAVIREFIFADYLKTKEECLRFYCRNVANYSPYKCTYGLGGILWPFLGYHYDHYAHYNIDYNVKTCTARENGITTILSEEDVLQLLSSVQEDDIKIILKNTINPPHRDIENLIEKEYNRKIFPIFPWENKSLLMETLSGETIICFSSLFEGIKLKSSNEKCDVSNEMITVTNSSNDITIMIAKQTFIKYCEFDTLIKDCASERIDTVTVPFIFHEKAGLFISKSLLSGKLEKINELTGNDVEEIKSLISFLQISLENSTIENVACPF